MGTFPLSGDPEAARLAFVNVRFSDSAPQTYPLPLAFAPNAYSISNGHRPTGVAVGSNLNSVP